MQAPYSLQFILKTDRISSFMTSPTESEWKRSRIGSGLERSHTELSGAEISEYLDPAIGRVLFVESYPGIQRTRYEYAEPGTNSSNFSNIDTPETLVLANDGSFTLLARLFPSENILHIGLKENSEPEFDWEVIGYRRLASFRYSPTDGTKALVSLRNIASRSVDEDISQRDWRAALPILLNYIKTSDDPNHLRMNKELREEELELVIEKKFPNVNHPKVAQAYQQAENLLKKILKEVPQTEAHETRALLASIGFEPDLIKHLLEFYIKDGKSIEEAIEEATEDRLLDLFIYLATRNFTPFSEGQDFIEINPETEDGFGWRITQKRVMEEENPSDLWSKGKYGEEIDVFGNKYKIFKTADTIVVLFEGREVEWTVTFPTSVPFEEIKRIMTEKDADFREIRGLLSKFIFKSRNS